MRVLAIDTSSELGSVACLDGGVVCAEVAARVRARHGETVFGLIEQVLAHAAIDEAELDLIACGLGPGTFTGTRVGVTAAKGLALALGLPVVGVSTLRALARAAPGRWLAPAVEAYRGEVYCAVYERDAGGLHERLSPTHAPPGELAVTLRRFSPLTRFGTGARRHADVLWPTLPPVYDLPRAAIVAQEALEALEARGPDDLATLEPSYVRPTDAQLPETAQPSDSSSRS